MPRHVIIVSFLVGLIAITGCAVNPVTRQSEFMIFSEQDEIRMGAQYHPQISAEYGVYEDKELTSYVNMVGQKVAVVSDRPNLKYTFTVLDSPILNAFAVPGGYIYITRGLLEELNSEDELAGVLGHEVGHVCARDSMRTLSSQYGLSLLFLGAQGVVDKDDFEAWAPWISGGMYLSFLNYGRDAEFRADELGTRYSTAAGYSPRGNTDVLRTLRKLGDVEPGSLAEILQTHPSTALRVDKARTLQKDMEQEIGVIPEKTDIFRSHLNGMVIGPNERHGKVIGNAYLNGYYDCYITIPASISEKIVGEPGLLFYGKAGDDLILALQDFSLERSVSAREFAVALEQKMKLSPTRSEARSSNGLQGWLGYYEVEGDFIARWYTVEGKKAFVVTAKASLGMRNRTIALFDAVVASFRHLTTDERGTLSVKRLTVHTVTSGESLTGIAAQYGVSATKLKDYNGLESSELYSGQKLKIPN